MTTEGADADTPPPDPSAGDTIADDQTIGDRTGDDQTGDPGIAEMPSALDVTVVELTNPGLDPILVTMTVGGSSRRIAVLQSGRSLLLVSPPGASWGFELVTADFDDEDPLPGQKQRGRSLGQ